MYSRLTKQPQQRRNSRRGALLPGAYGVSFRGKVRPSLPRARALTFTMKRLVTLCAFLLVACGDDAPSSAGPPLSSAPLQRLTFDLEALAPKDATFVVSTARWDAMREIMASNSWTNLFAYETLLDIRRTLAFAQPFDGEGESDPMGALLRLQGASVCFGRIADDQSGGVGVLLVEATDKRSDLAGLWTWLEVQLTSDWEGGTLDVGGMTIRTLTSPRKRLCFLETDRIEGLVLAEPIEECIPTIEGILARSNGSQESSITGYEPFEASRKGRIQGCVASAFVNLAQVMPMMTSRAHEEELAFVSALGLDRLEWAALDLAMGEREFVHLEARAPLPADSGLARLCAAGGSLPMEMLESFPAENLVIALGHVRIADALRSLEDTLDGRAQDAARELREGIAGFQEEFGVDLFDGLLDHCTGKAAAGLISIPWKMPDFSRRRPDLAVLFGIENTPHVVIEVDDSRDAHTRIERLLEGLHTGPTATARIGAHDVHWVDFGNEMFRPNYLLAGNAVHMGMRLESTRRVLRRIDGEETLDRAPIERMGAALEGHEDASVAVVTQSASVMGLIVGALRSAGMSFDGGWDAVRLPASLSIQARLRGQTVFAVRPDPAMLRLTLMAR